MFNLLITIVVSSLTSSLIIFLLNGKAYKNIFQLMDTAIKYNEENINRIKGIKNERD